MEANGVECLSCGEVAEGSDLTSDCEVCEGETQPVEITDCAIGSRCEDNAHHYGIGKHVKEIAR